MPMYKDTHMNVDVPIHTLTHTHTLTNSHIEK